MHPFAAPSFFVELLADATSSEEKYSIVCVRTEINREYQLIKGSLVYVRKENNRVHQAVSCKSDTEIILHTVFSNAHKCPRLKNTSVFPGVEKCSATGASDALSEYLYLIRQKLQ
ncbi:hypothetical protein AVEN_3778-1 [Araneus ventricosus]|uniref:Uncharacterized protein n=1 Tax=Araneus ventricosus TaxID=182803 RepID=A0A4Y2SFZ3_ARAVE|nr:hypothetical protein AVEN_3778-1 [Araneus ventricosus]